MNRHFFILDLNLDVIANRQHLRPLNFYFPSTSFSLVRHNCKWDELLARFVETYSIEPPFASLDAFCGKVVNFYSILSFWDLFPQNWVFREKYGAFSLRQFL